MRTVSQLEAQTIRAGSRAAPTDSSTRTAEPMAALLDRTASSPTDRFAQTARLSLKMQRGKDKLDSVLVNALLHPVSHFLGRQGVGEGRLLLVDHDAGLT